MARFKILLLGGLLSLLLSLFLGIFFPARTNAQNDSGWIIESFKLDGRVREDTDVDITETIMVDFDGLAKHGIYRDIPINYPTRAGNNININVSGLKVTDSNGSIIATKVSKKGNNLNIRIGDADKTVSGRNTYIITYTVSQVIITPNNDAEFYWNVTGQGWPVPILTASANIQVPKDALKDVVCFTGTYGEKESNCRSSQESDTAYFTAQNLNPAEGLTVSVAIDKNKLIFPSFIERLIGFLRDNLLYLSPLVVFAFMFRLYLLRGRDSQFINILKEEEGYQKTRLFEKVNAISVSVNPPDDLSPGEVGTLIDEYANLRDVTATVIDLARRGFMTISEEPKKGPFGKVKFSLDYIKKDEAGLKAYELSILNMLFTEKRNLPAVLTKLHPNAYKDLQEAQKKLYEDLSSRSYFEGRPDEIRTKYLITGIIIIFASIFLGSFIAPFLASPSSLFFALISSGIIIIAFSFFMPARSAQGRKALAEIAGFKEVLKLGAWRSKIYEKHNFFEETLPYAIAFGITEKFIEAFKSTEIEKLSWYKGAQPFNAVYFSSSINSFGTSLNSGIVASKPHGASSGGSGFGGGGFSGGGFGGGGGGSW